MRTQGQKRVGRKMWETTTEKEYEYTMEEKM